MKHMFKRPWYKAKVWNLHISLNKIGKKLMTVLSWRPPKNNDLRLSKAFRRMVFKQDFPCWPNNLPVFALHYETCMRSLAFLLTTFLALIKVAISILHRNHTHIGVTLQGTTSLPFSKASHHHHHHHHLLLTQDTLLRYVGSQFHSHSMSKIKTWWHYVTCANMHHKQHNMLSFASLKIDHTEHERSM